jgi:hypothetical protein
VRRIVTNALATIGRDLESLRAELAFEQVVQR